MSTQTAVWRIQDSVFLDDNDVDSKSRRVIVARDMYADGQPPSYNQQDWTGPLATKTHQERHRGSGDYSGSGSETSRPRSAEASSSSTKSTASRTMPPSSYPSAAMTHVLPVQTIPRVRPVISGTAGPSSALNTHQCNTCGKHRRAGSRSVSENMILQHSSSSEGAGKIIPTIQTNGLPLSPQDEALSAVSRRDSQVPLHRVSTTTPLVARPSIKRSLSRRSGSVSKLIRALSFSKRRSKQNGTRAEPADAEGVSPVSRDTTAQTSPSTKQYSNGDKNKLSPAQTPTCPDSPLSFADQPAEDEAFELGSLSRPKMSEHQRQVSWTKSDEQKQFLAVVEKPKYTRSQSTQIKTENLVAQEPPPQDDTFLGITPDQRPGVTRFKSLRSGVTRASSQMNRTASQIGRSKSMKRLGSVKKVPQLWYRDDMMFDGAGDYIGQAY